MVGNTKSKIVGDIPDAVNRKIDKTLSYLVDGYAFSPRFRSRRWDGRARLYNKNNKSYQTGCFFLVTKILKNSGIEFEVEDERVPATIGTPLTVYNKVPRDYQQESIDALLRTSRATLLAATGAGKTFIVANVIAKLNLPTIIYTHTCDLLYQMKEEIEDSLQIKCGQIGAGKIDIQQINVATMQTVIKVLDKKYVMNDEYDYADDEATDITSKKKQVLDFIKKCPVAIVDEVHHASAESLQTILKKSVNAFYRYGVTATMREKGDDLLIFGVLGRIVHTVKASELIRKGWLVPPTIYFYEVDYDIKMQQGSYQTIYKNCIVNNDYRNGLVVNAATRFCNNGKKVLILVRQINHGDILMKELLYQGLNVKFLQSKVDAEVRKDILSDFRSGDLDCLVATTLADEGLDIPILDAVILAGGGKSKIKAFQRVGRALRPFKGKLKAYIIEFMDNAQHLLNHSKKRLEVYQTEEEFNIKIQKK